jgi:branched-chain amino acid transport system substrate-binding protein
MSKMDELRAALKAANYNSVRGKYTYGNNHMPVQNFYLREVVADADGNWTTKVVKTVFENHHVDPYVSDCPMQNSQAARKACRNGESAIAFSPLIRLNG